VAQLIAHVLQLRNQVFDLAARAARDALDEGGEVVDVSPGLAGRAQEGHIAAANQFANLAFELGGCLLGSDLCRTFCTHRVLLRRESACVTSAIAARECDPLTVFSRGDCSYSERDSPRCRHDFRAARLRTR